MEPTFPIWVLYTYRAVDGQAVCNAYGYTSPGEAQAAGQRLQAAPALPGQGPLTFMVLPLQSSVA